MAEAIFEFDQRTFAADYNRMPFSFRHGLSRHPMLSVPALLALANRLPAHQVHQHKADIKIDEDFYHAAESHPTNRSIEDTMLSLAQEGSYVMLRNPHLDQEYGEFLRPLWQELGRYVDPVDPGLCEEMSFIFVSSPGAVTPFHIDRVANFHLQIQGEKVIYLWDPADREVVPEGDLAHVVAKPHSFRALYKPEYQSRARAFHQKPGLGVHHPWGAPHAVEVGSEVSVSLAVTFRSKEMKRRMRVHYVNHLLRRLGLQPSPFAKSPWRDTVKGAVALPVYVAVRRVRRAAAGRAADV